MKYREQSEIDVRLKRDFTTGMIFIQGSWGSVEYEGETYKMYGAYIHAPSEHTVTYQIFNILYSLEINT